MCFNYNKSVINVIYFPLSKCCLKPFLLIYLFILSMYLPTPEYPYIIFKLFKYLHHAFHESAEW